ncbi:MAG: hypothetical protein H6741_03045 [Alphaproteobacteria bacterium]|nr:hypothetical protein [Alphaproteobacteria bacterium]
MDSTFQPTEGQYKEPFPSNVSLPKKAVSRDYVFSKRILVVRGPLGGDVVPTPYLVVLFQLTDRTHADQATQETLGTLREDWEKKENRLWNHGYRPWVLVEGEGEGGATDNDGSRLPLDTPVPELYRFWEVKPPGDQFDLRYLDSDQSELAERCHLVLRDQAPYLIVADDNELRLVPLSVFAYPRNSKDDGKAPKTRSMRDMERTNVEALVYAHAAESAFTLVGKVIEAMVNE